MWFETICVNKACVYRYKMAVHQCEVCKKEFKGKSSLEMHFRTHSGKMTPSPFPLLSWHFLWTGFVSFDFGFI